MLSPPLPWCCFLFLVPEPRAARPPLVDLPSTAFCTLEGDAAAGSEGADDEEEEDEQTVLALATASVAFSETSSMDRIFGSTSPRESQTILHSFSAAFILLMATGSVAPWVPS